MSPGSNAACGRWALIDSDQALDRVGSAFDPASERDDGNNLEPFSFFVDRVHVDFMAEMFGDQLNQHLADQARFARA